MGCDIHYTIEVRRQGEWCYLNWRANYYEGTYDDGSPQTNWEKVFDDDFYIGRNYDLFAILANVRNGRGFAGVTTGTGFNPISQPRGLPTDAAAETIKQIEEWGINGHSHTYLTLAELLAYDWEQVTIQQGIVGEVEYLKFKETGKPTSWSGEVWGGKVRKVSPAEMDEILLAREKEPSMAAAIVEAEIEYYTRVSWPETYREAVGQHFFKTLDNLKTLGKPEDVRLVIWFDN